MSRIPLLALAAMIAVTHEAKIHGRPSAERDRLAATVRRARQLARRKQRHRGRR